MVSLLLPERVSKVKGEALLLLSVNVGSLIKLDKSLIGSQTKRTLAVWSFI